MRTNKPLLNFLFTLGHSSKCFVSNISQKKFNYTFEVGSEQKIHPMRELSMGTDRLLITPNLIALTDHGSGSINKQFSQNLDASYPERLLKVINSFFYKEIDKYMENPYALVESAVNAVKLQGDCSLTIGMTHPSTGEVVFYYIGDCLYGIFQERQVVMVEAVYEAFNEPIKIGLHPPQSGFVQRYAYRDIKNDTILVASNGLWDNVGLDGLHYEIRGPMSFESSEEEGEGRKKESRDGRVQGLPRNLQEMAERLGKIGAFYSRKGQYESPIYKRAQKAKFQYPKEGYLDDIAVMVARVKREVEIM